MTPRPSRFCYLALGLALVTSRLAAAAPEWTLFIGTFTPATSDSQGIYSLRMNAKTGALSAPVLAAAAPNPGFLALNPNGKVLYALGTSGTVGGKPGGAVAAFVIHRKEGTLSPLSLVPTGGIAITHLGADATARMLMAVSYNGSEIMSFPLAPDGQVGARVSYFKPTGPLGPNKDRQDKPHDHSVTYSPDNRFAYVCDLGLDKVFCFQLKPATAEFELVSSTSAEPGAGPRHSKFSADGRFLYVVNEVNNTVAVYACDPATGFLTARQVIPTLPPDFKGTDTAAEIRIHPNGRFVYSSNRGHNSIAVFQRHPVRGTLSLVEIVPSGGVQPRNFNLSPDGAWLVCGNADSNNLVVFKVDGTTGHLTPTGQTAHVPQPVCVLFLPTRA